MPPLAVVATNPWLFGLSDTLVSPKEAIGVRVLQPMGRLALDVNS